METIENEVLRVENLRVSFKSEGPPLTAVDGVSFCVKKGELVALVGESGCGKSMTSLAIMGLVGDGGMVSSSGIFLEGEDISKYGKNARRLLRGKKMSMIFQEPLTSLNPLFTIGDQIDEAIKTHEKISRAQRKERVLELIRRVGIPRPEQVARSYPNALSGGMRQRVMIAIALALNPKLLIADEPTTALDVTIQAQILALMRRLMKEYDAAIMLITHDLGVVAETADRVIVMYAGQIVEEADVFTLFHRPVHPYTIGLLNSTIKVHDLEDKLLTIEGTVPPLKDMPEGCRFHPRCSYAADACREAVPELTVCGEGHRARCLRANQLKREE